MDVTEDAVQVRREYFLGRVIRKVHQCRRAVCLGPSRVERVGKTVSGRDKVGGVCSASRAGSGTCVRATPLGRVKVNAKVTVKFTLTRTAGAALGMH